MTYRVTVEQHSTYLHVIGTGENTPENARQYLIDAHKAAVERNCKSILLDMCFSGPGLNLGSIYSVVLDRSPDGAQFERIAYIDRNPNHAPDKAEFAELVAQNRGVNVRLFRSITEAEHWLQESVGEK
jgi:hypothetical protein